MTRMVNHAAVELLMDDEAGPDGGPALVAYRCPAGVWTLGFGHTSGVKEGDTCTPEQAFAWLEGDIGWAEDEVERHVTVPLTDNQFSALVCFVFNAGRYAFDTSTMLREINAGDLADVPTQLRRWNKMHDPKTGQLVVSAGLTRRREDEIKIWNTPETEATASA